MNCINHTISIKEKRKISITSNQS